MLKTRGMLNGFVAALALGIGGMPQAASAATATSACPYTVAASGDYVVGNDLRTSVRDCITINASKVTIDLQGHTITGTGTGGAGITAQHGRSQDILGVRIKKFGSWLANVFSAPSGRFLNPDTAESEPCGFSNTIRQSSGG